MKETSNILVFTILCAIAVSCGSKTESSISQAVEVQEDTTSATDDLIPAAEAGSSVALEDDLEAEEQPAVPKQLTAEQKARRAAVEKETAERSAKRKLVLAERAKVAPTFKDKEGNIVYNKAEVDPVFAGGEKALKKYLRKNLEYPEDAETQGLEGTVFVDFVITKDGMVKEVEVTDNTNENVVPSLRREAMRVVSQMPRWIPGQQHGKPVDVRYSLPITFRML